MSNGQWTFPKVNLGDDVLVWTDPHAGSEPGYGKVIAIYPDTVDVVVFSERMQAGLRDCLHRNDPRIETSPGMFEFQERGVFDFTKAEYERREIVERMAAVEDLLEHVIEKTTSSVPEATATPAKRGPGRPRKQSKELAMVNDER